MEKRENAARQPCRLVVAEKPSVGAAIAASLGATHKMQGCFVGSNCIVSWCVGHLVELSEPEGYDPKYKRWCRADLPILPESWLYEVSSGTRDQFDVLKNYMTSPNVDSIICATDAGREGELIFRLVYTATGCTKPFKRLWISSLEESAIREGFANLRDGHDFDHLYDQQLRVGRVVTPTLALMTAREQLIQTFRPETFWHVHLSCGFPAKSKRISTREEAEHIREACHLKTAVVQSVERTDHANKPPYLYDLTTLQRDANRVYGYTAQQTLDYVQNLYEKADHLPAHGQPVPDQRYALHADRTGPSNRPELAELRASLETINKTASDFILSIDHHLRANEQERAAAPEHLFSLDDSHLVHIQDSDEGFDYAVARRFQTAVRLRHPCGPGSHRHRRKRDQRTAPAKHRTHLKGRKET